MAAYAVIVSVLQLLHPDQFPLHHRNPQIESIYGMFCSLRSSLEKIFPVPKRIKYRLQDLNVQIRDASYRAEDIIESFIVRQQIPSPEITIHGDQSSFLQDLHEIIAAIGPLLKQADMILGSIDQDSQVVANPSSENAQHSKVTRSSSVFSSTKIVGQEKDFEKMKDKILNDGPEVRVVPIVGLPGIGKTILIRSIYDDPLIIDSFDVRAWVKVPPDNELEDIIFEMLSSMERKSKKTKAAKVIRCRPDQLPDLLHQRLRNSRYLIVLDHMRDREVWDRLALLLPDKKNGSRLVLTTSHKEVLLFTQNIHYIHEIEPLDDENSWYLLCEKVFEDRWSCPSHLKDIGQEIALKCDGLPLFLIAAGGLLSQVDNTAKNWKMVLEKVTAAAGKGDWSYSSWIFYLIYDDLPVRLKACFLYMGAFPENTDIRVSKLIKLWIAEGFIDPLPHMTMEQVAAVYLQELIDRNLLVVREITSDGKFKACCMHNWLHHVAAQECEHDMLFYYRKRFGQQLTEDTNSRRRLSVHKNELMSLKDVYEQAKSMTSVRTIVYAGPYRHQPLPFCLTFDLLRVFDAFTVYFIVFPEEIVKLIHLRYLSFTYNGAIPSSISKLQKLQTLIIRRYPKSVLYLPVEIWDMPQLRHLIFTQSDSPMINRLVSDDSILLLANLQTLTNVDARSCTKEVLGNMPSLKKLGMWTEASGGAIGLNLDQLQQLEAFKFIVLDPTPMSKVEFQPKPYFPETLRKLTLSGCSLPWEDMTVIARLPCLEVLKLREMAFGGDNWCLKEEEQFVELMFLLLEYLDLKCWEAKPSNFPRLQRLILRHCHHLESIPTDQIAEIGCLELIEFIECSPYAVESAECIKKAKQVYGNERLTIRISSSRE